LVAAAKEKKKDSTQADYGIIGYQVTRERKRERELPYT
jgi:hypothetical protein